MLIHADRVVTPTRMLTPGWVRVEGERITSVSDVPPADPADHRLDGTLVPGFVDTHVHGGGGASFIATSASEIDEVVRTHRRHGTTSMIASLVSAPYDALETDLRTLAGAVERGALDGIHLEGPWLSPDFPGAHDASVLCDPDPDSVTRLLDAARGTMRMVTLAPERPGAIEAITAISKLGITAAIGHTGADYDTTRAAVDAGARAGTHLMNAMRPLHHRRPGPALALLEDPRVCIELIADGVHLHPAVLRDLAQVATGRFMLVTDAMEAAGFTDGDYRLGAVDVEVRDSIARVAGGSTIAGSTLTMDRAVRFAVHAGVPLPDAVAAASTTPARLHGLTDVGAIEPGRYADLVALDDDLDVRGVLRRGRWFIDP